jgi:hypothetical protein
LDIIVAIRSSLEAFLGDTALRKLWTAFNTTLALGLAFSIGCGGGGGGSSTPVTPVVYNGLTTQAVISTAADVDALTAGAQGAAQLGAVALGAQTQTQAAAPGPRSLPALLETLRGVSGLLKPDVSLAAGASASQTVNGTCGGSATLTVSGSSTPGYFSAAGSFIFNNYCNTSSDGVTVVINGSMAASLSGTDADNFVLSLSTTRINVSIGRTTYGYTIGNYACQVSNGYYGSVSLDCMLVDPAGGTYMLEDYQVLANASARSLVIQGRFYDYQRGFVEVTTPSPLTSAWCSQWGVYLPTSGAIRVTGASGIYGEFDPLNCVNYYLTIGNGTTSTQYLQAW